MKENKQIIFEVKFNAPQNFTTKFLIRALMDQILKYKIGRVFVTDMKTKEIYSSDSYEVN